MQVDNVSRGDEEVCGSSLLRFLLLRSWTDKSSHVAAEHELSAYFTIVRNFDRNLENPLNFHL